MGSGSAEKPFSRETQKRLAVLAQAAPGRPVSDYPNATGSGSLTTSSIQRDAAPPEYGTLTTYLQRQGAAVNDLHERINHLEVRLGGVLQSSPPDDSKPGPEDSPRCSLAEMAASITFAIELAARRVTSLRDRVDA